MGRGANNLAIVGVELVVIVSVDVVLTVAVLFIDVVPAIIVDDDRYGNGDAGTGDTGTTDGTIGVDIIGRLTNVIGNGNVGDTGAASASTCFTSSTPINTSVGITR
jgi:hypothetical protein